MTPPERKLAADAIAHALDLEEASNKGYFAAALDKVPVGEAVRVLRAAKTPKAIRRALAELTACVNRDAHARTKRAERANLVAQLVLVCDLTALLDVPPPGDVRATRKRITDLVGS